MHFRGGLGRPGRATRAAKLVEALISANRERNENLVKHINRLNFVLSLGVQLCARRLLCRLPARPCLRELQQHHDLFDNSLWWKKTKITIFLSKHFPVLYFLTFYWEEKLFLWRWEERSAKQQKVQEFDYESRSNQFVCKLHRNWISSFTFRTLPSSGAPSSSFS